MPIMRNLLLAATFAFGTAALAAEPNKTVSIDGSSCGGVPADEKLFPLPSTPSDSTDCKTWVTKLTRGFAVDGGKMDCGRIVLAGEHRCVSHMCGAEKSIPLVKTPTPNGCTCTEWKVAGEQTCSRKDDKGACVEWNGNCILKDGGLSCPGAVQTCVALHCHKAKAKGKNSR